MRATSHLLFIWSLARRRPPGKGLFTGRRYIAVAVLLAMASILAGCGRVSPHARQDQRQPAAIGRILIVPFINIAAYYGENSSVRNPLSGKAFVTGPVDPLAVDHMNAALIDCLRRRYDERLVGPADDFDIAPDLYGNNGLHEQVRRAIMDIGKRYAADAVMVGHLYSYKNRVGGAYGAETPAAVSFELNLIKSANGRLIWTGRFSDEQKTLNEDLLQVGKFVRRGGKWITAEEMADEGFDILMMSLSKKYH